MAKFEISIDLDGAAFEENPDVQVISILHHIINKLTGDEPFNADDQIRLHDANGNYCGFAEVTDNEDE